MWQNAESYELYIGRWSRQVARVFVPQLSIAPRSRWLEVGCGSGALTTAILELAQPSRVVALDRSPEFVFHTSGSVSASFVVADAACLPFEEGRADVAVSALVLNFVPQPERAVREMLRCVRRGGTIAVYVWDYAEGMQPIRFFWDAAVALDPAAGALDEANKFPLCRPEPLRQLFETAGAAQVRVSDITLDARFRDFNDLWSPFLGGQGPAPSYTMNLTEGRRAALREGLREIVPAKADGSIDLRARAWVVGALR